MLVGWFIFWGALRSPKTRLGLATRQAVRVRSAVRQSRSNRYPALGRLHHSIAINLFRFAEAVHFRHFRGNRLSQNASVRSTDIAEARERKKSGSAAEG